jgi:hypothetical protein
MATAPTSSSPPLPSPAATRPNTTEPASMPLEADSTDTFEQQLVPELEPPAGIETDDPFITQGNVKFA